MGDFPSEAELREPLLEFLQVALGQGGYAKPPARMTPGNDTEVHAFRWSGLGGAEAPLVLRVFRKDDDPQRALFEAALQNALADQGVPVPRALAIGQDPGVIGSPFFVMERAPGRPLYSDVFSTNDDGIPESDWRGMLRQSGDMLFEMPRLLAEVCLRIHAADAKPVVTALEAAGLPWRQRTVEGRLSRFANCVEEHGLEGLEAGVAWLYENLPADPPESVVCHGDLHPLNLVMERKEVSGVIDWANALLAPRELEIGWVRGLHATIEMPLPGAARLLRRPIIKIINGGYSRAYRRAVPFDPEAVAYYEMFRSLVGLSILGEQVVRKETIRDAWNSKTAIGQVVAHIRAGTGLEVSIPLPG